MYVTASCLVNRQLIIFEFLFFTRLASELCPECKTKVTQNICNIVRFRIVLTCVPHQICVNVGSRALSMRLAVRAAISARQTHAEMPETLLDLE